MSAKKTEILSDEHFIRSKLRDPNRSILEKYCNLVIGEVSLLELIKYELITSLLGWMPGAVGLVLRKLIYPFLFKEIGKNVVFGRNATIRCPKNIQIDDNVVIDDTCFIDGRGAGEEKLSIGKNCIISRGSYVQSKKGPLHIGENTIIGEQSAIVSQGGVFIAESCGIAGGCKIGGGLFSIKEDSNPSDGEYFTRYTKGPIRIGKNSIIAFGAVVVDGVTVGERCMIGPGALVIKKIIDGSSVTSYPAIVMKSKADSKSQDTANAGDAK